MATLAVVALAVLPMLTVRDASWNIAYRSTYMMRAANLAETLLAAHVNDPRVVKDEEGVFEEDAAFRWKLSLEDFDVSTGRVEEPTSGTGAAGESAFSSQSKFGISDGVQPAEPKDADSPYRVRRFKLTIYHPALDGEQDVEYVLEGFLPRATESETGSLLGGAQQ